LRSNIESFPWREHVQDDAVEIVLVTFAYVADDKLPGRMRFAEERLDVATCHLGELRTSFVRREAAVVTNGAQE
jgi:hypothetical protein